MSTRPTSDALTQAQDQFVAVWGQMGSAWGISRTMAEAHALLARALWESGTGRARALSLAREAVEVLAKAGKDYRREHEEARAWLAHSAPGR